MPRSARPPVQDAAPLFNTTILLLLRYGDVPVVPMEDVCCNFFRHLTAETLIRKVSLGEMALPLVRIEASQKSAKGVALVDLAAYLDQRIDAARRECDQLCG